MMAENFIPLRATYDGRAPTLYGELDHAGAGAVVLGRVTLGSGAWLYF